MQITLTPEQETWLQAQVAMGEFSSVEDAARTLLDQRIATHQIGADPIEADLAWAKPYVDEGLAALERGEVISLSELKARNAARLVALSR